VKERLLRKLLALVCIGSGKIAAVQHEEFVNPDSGVAEPCSNVVGLKGWRQVRLYPRTQFAQIAHGPPPLTPVFAHSPSRVPHLKHARSWLATKSAIAV
jgi:hypothetical protein